MDEQEDVYPDTADTSNEVGQDQTDVSQEAQYGEYEGEQSGKMVPLTALQKERRKRQQSDERIRYYERKLEEKESESDDSYESVTKKDLGSSHQKLKREISEELWISQNPHAMSMIDNELDILLEQKPHLTAAIASASNRYEVAYDFLKTYGNKSKSVLQSKPKSNAPGSPGAVPKSAAMSDAVDLMKMDDTAFNAWRKERRTRR